MTRRELIAAGVGFAFFGDRTWSHLERLSPQVGEPTNEEFWEEVRRAFTIPDEVLSLNHVGLSATPNRVLDAQIAEERRAARAPSLYVYREQRTELARIKARVATFLGADAECVALTPNATYGLHTAILGVPLKAGQKIVSTDHDYSRAWNAMEQRRDRDGVVLETIEVPPGGITDHEYVEKWLRALTADVGLAVLCSVTYLTGHVIPFEEVISHCHHRGIPVLIDTAQSVGLRPFDFKASNADFMTACLHKWVMAPVGSGVFLVRKDQIKDLWPLAPPDPAFREQIAKFEQFGTFPFATFLAYEAAFDFHDWIGMKRKSDRLLHLRTHIQDRLREMEGIRFYSSLDRSRHDGMMTIGLQGLSGGDFASVLLREHRIHVTTSVHAGIDGIRVSPHIFMTLKEMDIFVDSVFAVSKSILR
ncbi:MAG: aminotransferase class V-fold PLP-dependent enzyme [Fimbriimonadaceae bacterium]|nr:aminotransferase class V-fold PLP-dependent enzyme [Fimbriimonadaceae bacterium]